ncbi:MAG TPA: mandelate racemase [Beijerinckiaceae bacterium]|jgi:L-alanine-DL-glutamate epimerase-like enolase superfamily enzyme
MPAADAPRLKLVNVERFERDVRLRLPFRFGVTTVTHATQGVIRVTVALADGRTETGVAAETLAAKWFDKNLALSDEENLDQLRQSLEIAVDLYGARGFDSAFGHYAGTYREQQARAAALDLNPLVASYGPALLDRAIVDSLGRALQRSFPDIVSQNLAGVRATDLTPDLAGFDLEKFLGGLRMAPSIEVRHTVGLVDPITGEDQRSGERVDDGLPETLEEVVRHYGGRYYKLKVGGDVTADLERLTRIAAVLDRALPDYRATLDGNEQYENVEGIAELWRRMRETPALERLVEAILFIEQPIKRQVALARPVAALAREKPLEIDESDGELASFPAAIALGYTGVSSKNCKGFYKSLLNAARVARLNAEAGRARYFMSAEDLTTWAGVSVQQDLCLVSLLGLAHVERNGHHFIDGMSFAPEAEQAAFAAAHPDLYEKHGGPARLRIAEGRLSIASLACPGFAIAAPLDFGSMRPMPAAPREPIGRIRPKAVGAKA